jgi:hypothetical protein
MNVEIGAEAAQFPEKEYINGIAFAVYNDTALGVISAKSHRHTAMGKKMNFLLEAGINSLTCFLQVG